MALELTEFTQAYSELCNNTGVEPVEELFDCMAVLVESGEIPDSIKLNGNSEGMRNKRLNDAHGALLFTALSKKTFLTNLDVSYNELSNESAQTIARFLIGNSSLKYLNLSSNNIGPMGVGAICKALHSNEHLKGLDLSHNPILDEGGMHVAAMLQINYGITYLNLTNTSMTPKSVIAFSTVLKVNRSLLQLHIGDNNVRSRMTCGSLHDDMVQHLGKVFRFNGSLTELSLSKMALQDCDFLTVIAPWLKKNSTLATLDFSGNRLMRDAGVALANALIKHPTVTTLKLSHNNIQEGGAKAFKDMLLFNNKLVNLYLDHNNISSAGLSELVKAFSVPVANNANDNEDYRNKTLRLLTLWGNHWDASACEKWYHMVITAPERQTTRFRPENVDFTFYPILHVLSPLTKNPELIWQALPTDSKQPLNVALAPCMTTGLGPGTITYGSPDETAHRTQTNIRTDLGIFAPSVHAPYYAPFKNVWVGNTLDIPGHALIRRPNALSLTSPWEIVGELGGYAAADHFQKSRSGTAPRKVPSETKMKLKKPATGGNNGKSSADDASIAEHQEPVAMEQGGLPSIAENIPPMEGTEPPNGEPVTETLAGEMNASTESHHSTVDNPDNQPSSEAPQNPETMDTEPVNEPSNESNESKDETPVSTDNQVAPDPIQQDQSQEEAVAEAEKISPTENAEEKAPEAQEISTAPQNGSQAGLAM